MMPDRDELDELCKRLRQNAQHTSVCFTAADEIERLRRELAEAQGERDLSNAAIAEIRHQLTEAGFPNLPFIDDCVVYAVQLSRVRGLRDAIEAACPHCKTGEDHPEVSVGPKVHFCPAAPIHDFCKQLRTVRKKQDGS